jgi:hypothetical protein
MIVHRQLDWIAGTRRKLYFFLAVVSVVAFLKQKFVSDAAFFGPPRLPINLTRA